MAIQIPNPGTGNGATGDNEFVLWTKVKDNFSNQTHAASKLVGTAAGNVMGVGAFGLGLTTTPETTASVETLPNGFFRYATDSEYMPAKMLPYGGQGIVVNRQTSGYAAALFLPYYTGSKEVCLRVAAQSSVDFLDIYFMTTANTTKEPTTGYLKAASPILHLFNDNLEKEHEAVEQDIIVEKLGVGDYLIKGSTGLSSEGWNLSPPKDIHGNVLCMVEATEVDGNINVKTYKRKFDFDIVAIVPDYDQPFDIPEGHSVDLRLNNLPYENLDDIQTEV